jgi:hypothetical protein
MPVINPSSHIGYRDKFKLPVLQEAKEKLTAVLDPSGQWPRPKCTSTQKTTGVNANLA